MTQKVNAQSLENDIINVFKILDRDSTGYFTANDLHILTRKNNCEKLVEKFVNKADLGGEGQMEYEGFIRSMLKR
jgi:Ca2+-binding EF-hand superfamily protein